MTFKKMIEEFIIVICFCVILAICRGLFGFEITVLTGLAYVLAKIFIATKDN